MKKKNYKVKLKVKELLEERNITQKKLAQISGIRESTISDIVRGTRTVINDRSAELYACGMFWMHDRLLDWNI